MLKDTLESLKRNGSYPQPNILIFKILFSGGEIERPRPIG
jgi:hypothetical protein